MSRQMRGFADYFMQGMAMGSKWAEQWQAGQIAAARNKIMAERNAAQERRENAKLSLYGQKTASDIELARARAHRLMNPTARGGGGKGPAGPDPEVERLEQTAIRRGHGMTAPEPAPPAGERTVYLGADPSETDAMSGGSTDGTPPVEEVPIGAARGGMIRKMAAGGVVSHDAEMTLEEAMAYRSKPKPDAAGALGASLGRSIMNYKPKEEIINAAPGGISGEMYNRGGAVRTFQSGGRVLREPTAIDTGMSGPGSGFGQRASPPAGARRRY